MKPRTLLFLALALPCCSAQDDTQPTQPYACDAGTLLVDGRGIVFAHACEGMDVHLLPRVLVGGQWQGGETDACTFDGAEVRCTVDAGEVAARVEGNEVSLRFEARETVEVQGLSLAGGATLRGARGFLSNGFQSWSQSGVLALGPSPTAEQIARALSDREDREVGRGGTELSWWYTYAGGGDRNFFAGVLTTDVFRSYAQVHLGTGPELVVNLASGGAGESVPVQAGQVLEGERWHLGLSSDLDGMLARYAAALPSRRASKSVPADAGWNSWYDLWDKVTEQDVRENAPLARAALEGRVPATALPLRIVIDDGWQQRWGEWEANDKFPSGMAGLAADLKAQGFRVGIWLAPLLVDDDSPLVSDHPTWFLQDAMYPHPTNGTMRILDPTEPEAAAHIQAFIQRIVSWGYDFLKIDFLFAGTYEEPRHAQGTGMQAYHEALRLIRDAAGEDTILLAVGAPSHPSLPYVDAWRLGGDIAFEPADASWFFIPNQARSIAARWHLCGKVLCDADPPLLRRLPQNEVDVGVWVAALAGGALFLSDDLRDLEPGRVDWLGDLPAQLAVRGEAVPPVDVFPKKLPDVLTNPIADVVARESRHVLPSVWELPDSRLVINFGDEDATIEGSSVPARSARLEE
jgi:hypothetical protein